MQSSIILSKRSGSIRTLLFALFIPLLLVLAVLPSTDVQAQGNLVIIPRRVVFEGTTKTQEITLANGGTDTAKYIISIVQMRMKEDGSFEEIKTPDPGQNFADKYLRFYPRTVTLAPRESQMVKIQLVKAEKLEAGEYRSHIYFRAVPKTKPRGANEASQDTTFSATLNAVFGITMPVIIRVGESTGKVTLSDVSFNKVNDTVSKCKITFNRTGNTSTYGDIVVNYTSIEGKVTQVSIVRGFAVYTPNAVRRFDCKLDNIAGVDYRKGKLNIVYSTQVGTSTKPLILAEAELILK